MKLYNKIKAIIYWKIMVFLLKVITWADTGEWVPGKAVVEFGKKKK